MTVRSAKAAQTTREEARRTEAFFVEGFARKLARLGAVVHPEDGRSYPCPPEGPRRGKHLERVVAAMDACRVHEREVVDEMPLDLCASAALSSRGFLGGRGETRVRVAAFALSPMEALVGGEEPPRADRAGLDRVLREAVGPREVFHYLGVLATAGWEASLAQGPPTGEHWLVALVEPAGGTRFRVHTSGEARWGGMAEVFDPESDGERRGRARAHLASHRDLELRGGHVLLADAAEALGLDEAQVLEAARDLAREERELEVLEVAGRTIIKRRRV
ncbi:MAG: hypothetical protein HY722_09520 [Planctomycetes bacterium]|nr:hypothetical protein [Planctomycetota bacterium]